jgi:hypothetical protein
MIQDESIDVIILSPPLLATTPNDGINRVQSYGRSTAR